MSQANAPYGWVLAEKPVRTHQPEFTTSWEIAEFWMDKGWHVIPLYHLPNRNKPE